MVALSKILSGGDLRSIGKSNKIVRETKTQKSFDQLFKCLQDPDRLVVMRAADAIEKISIQYPEFLQRHKDEIIELCQAAKDKELLWHLALLTPRLHLQGKAFDQAWDTLAKWAKNKANSRIVRVNSIQGLYEMQGQRGELKEDFDLLLAKLESENIPSINARIRKIKRTKN